MATGEELVVLARKHEGEDYEHVLAPKNNPNWHGPWDCSEFVSWVVFQCTGRLYGCLNDTAAAPPNPALAKAFTGAWKDDSVHFGERVPVERAAAIAGGILLRYPPGPGVMGHVVLCDGRGGTIEAMGHRDGVKSGRVQGRRWDTGVLIPWVTYDQTRQPIAAAPPTKIYFGLNRFAVRGAAARDVTAGRFSSG